MDTMQHTLFVPKLQRHFAATILAIYSFVNSSCSSYRLNYVAQIEINSFKDGDQLIPKNAQEDEPSPASDPIEKNIYRYKYGANYSTALLPFACAATFWVYGGFCWGYLGVPFADDELDIEARATTNLQTLLAGRDYRILKSYHETVEQTRDQPYYLLIDRDGSILAKGHAPATIALANVFKQPEAKENETEDTPEVAAGQTEDKASEQTSEAATEETPDIDAGGLSEAAAMRGFSFAQKPDEDQDAGTSFKRGFILGHLHVSAVLGLGIQVGHRLTEKDSLSLSYFYDWYNKNRSNAFVGVSYQRFFGNSFFLQTSLGRLESKIEYYDRWNEWYGMWRSSRLIGPAANLIIGMEERAASDFIVGFDLIGYHFGLLPQQRDIMWPKLRIGKVF